MNGESKPMRVHRITFEAASILSFELRSIDDSPLQPFKAGAHIDLNLRDGLVRSYSLVNDEDERDRYVIAVNKDPASRGGSAFMHDELRVGALLSVSAPRNNFPLAEDATASTFIAGGVGITPIVCMLRRLNTLGRRWTLYYCARTRRSAAYLSEVLELCRRGQGNLHMNFDQGVVANALDLGTVVAKLSSAEHVYCCGPLPMLERFEQLCAALPAERVHREYFASKEAPAVAGGFVVELARSQRQIPVPKGMTILDALLGAGLRVPYSCTQGVCGSCETRVLAGVPDHKDLVLTREEQAHNDVMMICCSGSKTDSLTLDL